MVFTDGQGGAIRYGQEQRPDARSDTQPPGSSAGRARRIRQLRRRATRRGRTGTVASVIPGGRRAGAGS